MGTPVPPVTMPPSTVPPTSAPAGDAEAPPSVLTQPGVVEPPADPGENATLALALSSLIDQSPPAGSGSDRRAVALVALALLMVDGTALAALGRRNGWWQLGFERLR